MAYLMEDSICEPGSEGPMTVSISRKVKPGCEAEYEQCLSGLIEAASRFSGHQGAVVLRPSSATNHEYVTIYRFDNYYNCQQWEHSETRRQLVGSLDNLVEGEASTHKATGLEFWFSLPDLPVSMPPRPYKMALVLILVVYALIMGLNVLLHPILGSLPTPFRVFVVVVIQVFLMTYFIMPKVTQLLKGWLFKR